MKELRVIALQGENNESRRDWSRTFVRGQSDRWVIICRDDLRNMMGDFWVPERENLAIAMEYDSIATALEMGFNVIINHNNLNEGTIRKIKGIHSLLQKPIHVELEFKKM